LIEQIGDPFAGLVLELREQSREVLDRVTLVFGLAQRRREREDEGLQARPRAVDPIGGHLRLSQHVAQPAIESESPIDERTPSEKTSVMEANISNDLIASQDRATGELRR